MALQDYTDDPDLDSDSLWFLRREPVEVNPYQVIKLRSCWWVQWPDGDLEGPFSDWAIATDRADECWAIGRP